MSLSESILQHVNRPHQFAYENGIRITHVEPGLARGELRVNENSFNPNGTVHGGALATLADTVGGCCACSKGGHCVTATSTLEYLRPATGEVIFCQAVPKKLGQNLSFIELVLTNEQNVVIATGTFTFFMMK